MRLIKIHGMVKNEKGNYIYSNHIELSEDELFEIINEKFQQGEYGCPINENRETCKMILSIESIE